jgi:hypothetical protein
MKKILVITFIALTISSCTDKDFNDQPTSFEGVVLDYSDHSPIAKANVKILKGDDISRGLTEVINTNEVQLETDEIGQYHFSTINEQNTVYFTSVAKDGYVEVKKSLYVFKDPTIKLNAINKDILFLGKAAYLDLNIMNTKVSSDTLRINLVRLIDLGGFYIDEIESVILNQRPSDTTLNRSYFYQDTPNVILKWTVKNAIIMQSDSLSINLIESDTVKIDISY